MLVELDAVPVLRRLSELKEERTGDVLLAELHRGLEDGVNLVEHVLLAFGGAGGVDFVIGVLLQVNGVQVFGLQVNHEVVDRGTFFAHHLHHVVHVHAVCEDVTGFGPTLVEGAKLLKADGIKTRIVSVPSEGLFRTQSKEYQQSVIPAGAKVFGLTAGLPVNLEGLVGANGKVWGLQSFGFSAPYKVLDEKLGFTAENVYNQVKSML